MSDIESRCFELYRRHADRQCEVRLSRSKEIVPLAQLMTYWRFQLMVHLHLLGGPEKRLVKGKTVHFWPNGSKRAGQAMTQTEVRDWGVVSEILYMEGKGFAA